VEPNPCVGAVVLDADGRPVASGVHSVYGGPHAEVVALAQAGERARGGTLVTTLEPCAHSAKKTSPCVPAIVAAGVARVVAGTGDPNPVTAGRAAAELAAAGVGYDVGVLEGPCRAALARYAAHLAVRRPWTIAKWAMSLDGRTADASGASRWISGEASRGLVHVLRGAVDAIVVGTGTVVADDPSLVPRVAGTRTPLRVVLDSGLRVPASARVVVSARETPTLFVCADGAPHGRRRLFEDLGVEVACVAASPGGGVDVAAAFAELHRRGVRRVLLEAGGTLTAACFAAGVVDQVAVFVAPLVLGGQCAPSPLRGGGWPLAQAPRIEETRVLDLPPDALVEGYLSAAPSAVRPSAPA
jgi:diaminohydroxyphosphoribosylaminopyrimidine deaminase/5-amino-6-(5-phosphoribosylamino)uracil reductase